MSDRKVGQVAKLLIDARKLIEDQERWIKGCYETSDKLRHCTVGALNKVAHTERSSWFAVQDSYRMIQARSFLAEAAGVNFDLEGWNDAPETSHEDVILAFDKAINMALARGI